MGHDSSGGELNAGCPILQAFSEAFRGIIPENPAAVQGEFIIFLEKQSDRICCAVGDSVVSRDNHLQLQA